MSHDQAAHAGLDAVRELLEAMMRSLEERMAPPPPPPSLLARLRRLVSGRALADQVGRVACAMLRARLGRFTSDLTATVTAELEAFTADREPAATPSIAPPTASGARGGEPVAITAGLGSTASDAALAECELGALAITGATEFDDAPDAGAVSVSGGRGDVCPRLTEAAGDRSGGVTHAAEDHAIGLDATGGITRWRDRGRPDAWVK